MKFAELKKSLKLKIENAYFLKGDDEFLLSRAYDLILDACKVELSELNVSIFRENIDFEMVVKALETLPMMSEKRVVYVKITSKDFSNDAFLEKYIKNINPSSVLVISVGSTGYLKNLEKFCTFVDCGRLDKTLIFPFVVADLKRYNKSIGQDACTLLCDYSLNDMAKVNNEVVKLVSYVGDRGMITADDVKLMVGKAVEFQIYELTEALAKKNSAKVFEILNVLKAKKDEYRTLHALIYKHFRRLFFVSITAGTKAELSKMLGVHEFAITKAQEQSRLYTKKQLKEIVDMCMKLDFDIKQSNITPENAIDYIVLKILNYKN